MNKQNYFGDFTSWTDEVKDTWNSFSVMGQFQEDKLRSEPECVWAQYAIDGYEGYALVVFKEGDTWYQVYGSHCSCYGLEGQWAPEVLDVGLHLEALNEGKTLLAGYCIEQDPINEWLREMTK